MILAYCNLTYSAQLKFVFKWKDKFTSLKIKQIIIHIGPDIPAENVQSWERIM